MGEKHADVTSLQPDEHPLRHNGFRLLVLTGELRGREIDVLSEAITVGKSRSCDVVLPDESVSRVHAEIRREGESYRLRDRGSTSRYGGVDHAGDVAAQPRNERSAPGVVAVCNRSAARGTASLRAGRALAAARAKDVR